MFDKPFSDKLYRKVLKSTFAIMKICQPALEPDLAEQVDNDVDDQNDDGDKDADLALKVLETGALEADLAQLA